MKDVTKQVLAFVVAAVAAIALAWLYKRLFVRVDELARSASMNGNDGGAHVELRSEEVVTPPATE